MRLPLRAIAVAVLALAVGGFVALMAWGLQNQSPATGKSGRALLDKPAYDFSLPRFDGGELTLSDHVGQPIVINFWASWCTPCRVEAPTLETAWRSYSTRGVMFVGVQTQDTEEDGRAYIREFDLTYPNVIDGDGEVTVRYGVSGLPVTFFVGKGGVVDHLWVGDIDESQLTTQIEEMLSDAPTGANP